MSIKRGRGRPIGSIKGKHPTRINGKRTRTYIKWLSMRARCSATAGEHHRKYYSDMGISVCPEWLGRSGYDQFMDDMGEVPPGLTLERKDNKLGYSKSNCKWATWKEQAQNRRPVGPKPNPNSLSQKAKRAGIPYPRAYQRIFIADWTEDEALSTPVQPRGKYGRTDTSLQREMRRIESENEGLIKGWDPSGPASD